MLLRIWWPLGVLLTTAATETFELTLLPESTFGDSGGRCLDGSMAGYYYTEPTSGNSSLWVIWMDGGGACYDETSCKKRALGHLGSSKKWAKSTSTAHTILSSNSAVNPDFHNAHKVWIPYCTGDCHAGQVTKPTSDQWGLYFSGHLNLKNILDHIKSSNPAMQHMERVVLSGSSAGGVGTFKNCDFLQSYLTGSSLAAKVGCAPQAGWFKPGMSEDQPRPEYPPSDWSHWSNGTAGPSPTSYAGDLWQEYKLPECIAAYPKEQAYFCSSVHVLYPYIKTPVYVLENQFDSYQLGALHGGPPVSERDTPLGRSYIAYYGRAMRNSTHQVVNHPLGKVGDGLFHPSCYQHGVSDIKTKVSGYTAIEGLGDWFFGRGKVPKVLVDDCKMEDPGLPCNPTCPGLTPSPGPAPGPGPAPLPASCEAELQSDCGRVRAKAGCLRCLEQHYQDLAQAGCPQAQTRTWCKGGLSVVV